MIKGEKMSEVKLNGWCKHGSDFKYCKECKRENHKRRVEKIDMKKLVELWDSFVLSTGEKGKLGFNTTVIEQEFVLWIYKKYITLQSRWEKLKEWIEVNSRFITTGYPEFKKEMVDVDKLLRKIEELEKEGEK